MGLLPPDFESGAYTNFATPACEVLDDTACAQFGQEFAVAAISATSILILRSASSDTNLFGSIAASCGVAPRIGTSPHAIICAMIDDGNAVVLIIAESP